MKARVITLPGFQVVGYKAEANIDEFESGIGKTLKFGMKDIDRKVLIMKSICILL